MPGFQDGSSPVALSIDVEDWFHSENIKPVMPRESWDAAEFRVERNTRKMLDILRESGAHATFFILGWVAEKCPALVRAIADDGHEIASHGYAHELVYTLTPEAFRSDVLRARELLQDISGVVVRGYRAPCFSITNWAIPILRDVGYSYDSSVVNTIAHDRYGHLDGFVASELIAPLEKDFYEVCVSCVRVGRRGVPWGGGGYFRLVPYRLWTWGVDSIRRSGEPYVFYIHPWEIDPGHPRMAGISMTSQFRQRVNLSRCAARFRALTMSYRSITIGDLLESRVHEHDDNSSRVVT